MSEKRSQGHKHMHVHQWVALNLLVSEQLDVTGVLADVRECVYVHCHTHHLLCGVVQACHDTGGAQFSQVPGNILHNEPKALHSCKAHRT